MNSPKVDRPPWLGGTAYIPPTTTMNLVFITWDVHFALTMTVTEHTKSLWPTECGKLFSTNGKATHTGTLFAAAAAAADSAPTTRSNSVQYSVSPVQQFPQWFIYSRVLLQMHKEKTQQSGRAGGEVAFSNAYTTHLMFIFVGDLHLSISRDGQWWWRKKWDFLLNNNLLFSCRKLKDLNNSRKRIIIFYANLKSGLDTWNSPWSWIVFKICIYEKLVPWSLKSRFGSGVLKRIYGRIN